MLIDGKPIGWTIEDEHRDKKVMSETRIPAGTYRIGLRTEGKHHLDYIKKFPTIHKGMLELQDVPNFKYILIHIGNTEVDTAGCILVGSSPNLIGPKLSISSSTVAYQQIYKTIIDAILIRKENVTITIEDKDR